MEHAKDLIADEQWVRAIDELKAAVADPKETNKDEALFWLAHSLNQAHDGSGAVQTIRRLEREYPSSLWVKPARSLRIEIAQRLQRSDVLWYNAAPPLPPSAPTPTTMPTPTAMPTPAFPPPAAVPPTTAPVPVPASASTPRPPACAKAVPPPAPAAPPPPALWVPEGFFPDMDLRIQALARLMRTDAPKGHPDAEINRARRHDAGEGRRALLVLAQSDRPEARATVFDVAKTGPERMRLVAVRELGRLGVRPSLKNCCRCTRRRPSK